MNVTVISASTMTSVRNITNNFLPVRRDREMTFAGSSILTEIIPILAIYDHREWFTLVLLRNEAEATVRCFFCAILHPKHRGESKGQPAGCLFAPLWLHVVSTSNPCWELIVV